MTNNSHGDWGAAETSRVGRSGGTEVLAKRPIHTSRGAGIPWASSAVVCWTRAYHLRLILVYSSPDTDPQFPNNTWLPGYRATWQR